MKTTSIIIAIFLTTLILVAAAGVGFAFADLQARAIAAEKASEETRKIVADLLA